MKTLINKKIVQNIILWSFLIIAAVGIIGALAYATNFAYFTARSVNYKNGASYLNQYYYPGEDQHYIWNGADKEFIYTTMDNYKAFCNLVTSVNNYLLISHVIIVALFAVMCILGNKYRKKYYLENLIGGIAVPVISIVLVLVGIVQNKKVVSSFNDNIYYLRAHEFRMDQNNSTQLNTNFQTAMLIIMVIEIVIFALVCAYTVVKYLVNLHDDKSSLESTDETEAIPSNVEAKEEI